MKLNITFNKRSTVQVFLGFLLTPALAAAQPAGDPPADGEQEVIEVEVAPEEPVEAIEVEAGPGAPAPPPRKGRRPPARKKEESAIDVTVAGTPVGRTPGSAHVIGKQQLEAFEYDDPHAVLMSAPGVYTRGEDGAGLRPNIGVRGVNPDRSKKVALMEDGIPFSPAPYSAPAAYYFPIMTRMQAVRVIKGPAALAYGPQTIGGAIDLITRYIPTRPSGQVDLAYGQYGYRKVHGWYGFSNEKTGALIEGVHIGSDGFKELPNGADTGFYRNEWMFKGAYTLDPYALERHELKLKLSYSDELSNETYLGLTDADFRDNPRRRYGVSQLDQMKWHRTGLAATHVFTPSPKLTITTTAYRQDFSRSWRKVNGFRGAPLFDVLTQPETAQNAVYYSILSGQADSSTAAEAIRIGPNQREFVVHGIETRVRADTHTGPLAHRLEYAVRLHYDRIERRHTEDTYLVQGGQLIPEGAPTVTTAFNEAASDALSMHVIDAITFKRLTVTPGVRLEVVRSRFEDKITGESAGRIVQAVMPGVGAYYALTRDFGALAGVYRGYSPPAPGSADFVDPEYSINTEAGVRYDRRRSRAELIGFYNDYQNLTDVCTLSSGCLNQDLDRQFDAGAARIYGMEAFAEHTFKAGALEIPVSAAYTLTMTEFLRSFTSDDPIFGDVEAGDELPYVPRHQAHASVGVGTKRVGGVVGATYVSRMREEAGAAPLDDVLATDEQFVMDVGGKYRVLPPIELYLNVRNVLDSQYIVSRRPFGARPNAPRWIQVGAKASF